MDPTDPDPQHYSFEVALYQQFISLIREELVEELANKLGLVRVGWIFTDLVPLANGKVRNKLLLFLFTTCKILLVI
jgi:hypothetical protein